MNKSTWVMIVVLLTALTGTSHAATTFDFFKMVGATEVSGGSAASQSATARSTYNLSETPYLYYHVSTPISANVFTFWLSPLNSSSMVTDTVSTSDSEGWLSLSNWNTLPANQKLGNWNVTGYMKEGRTLLKCATTNFVVTPEPMAMVLYGMGGLPLAAHFLRRRKQIAA